MSDASFQLGPSPTNCTDVNLEPNKIIVTKPDPSYLVESRPGRSATWFKPWKKIQSRVDLFWVDRPDRSTRNQVKNLSIFFLIFELSCSYKTRALCQVSSRIMFNNYDQNHVNLFPRWDVNLLYWGGSTIKLTCFWWVEDIASVISKRGTEMKFTK